MGDVNKWVSRFGWVLCAAYVAAQGCFFLQRGGGSYLEGFALPAGLVAGLWLLAQLGAYLVGKHRSQLVASGILLICMAAMLAIACGFLRLEGMEYLLLLPVIGAGACGDSNLQYLILSASLVGLWASYYLARQPALPELGVTAAVFLAAFVLTRVTSARIERLEQDHREQLQDQMTAATDPLTGLGSQGAFYRSLDERILRYRQTGEAFALLLLDIDDFKAINAEQGREVGDRVLGALADIIRSRLEEGDSAFRYGGEEFTIFTTPQGGHNLAQQIRLEFARHRLPELPRAVTLSGGVCVYNDSFGGRREFFAAAETALYRAKHSGKNCVRLAQ